VGTHRETGHGTAWRYRSPELVTGTFGGRARPGAGRRPCPRTCRSPPRPVATMTVAAILVPVMRPPGTVRGDAVTVGTGAVSWSRRLGRRPGGTCGRSRRVEQSACAERPVRRVTRPDPVTRRVRLSGTPRSGRERLRRFTPCSRCIGGCQELEHCGLGVEPVGDVRCPEALQRPPLKVLGPYRAADRGLPMFQPLPPVLAEPVPGHLPHVDHVPLGDRLLAPAGEDARGLLGPTPTGGPAPSTGTERSTPAVAADAPGCRIPCLVVTWP
jgi:hypothetical protein